MRLIDADALKRRAITVRFFGKDIMMVPTAEIDEAPTIDAVSLTGTMKYLTKPHNYCEVVRCKDCKWHKLIGCEIKIVDDSDRPKDNDYCIFGERREP